MAGRYYLGGGIGSGKSTAAAIFRRLGAVVIEADRHGHAVLAGDPEVRAAVAARWPQVIGSDGTVDRAALGQLVFADPAELRALEEITWPAIRRRVLEEVAAHPDDIVMVEVPVLRDLTGEDWPWIVVDAPDEVRLSRAVARSPGATAEGILAVMARQPSREAWREKGAWVVDNARGRRRLRRECTRVWRALAGAEAAR